MQDNLIAVTQADKEAAFKLVVGEKVGAGDGNTYVVRSPSIAQVEQAFARHRQQAEDAMRERCAEIADNHVAMGYMSGRERDYCHEHGDEIAELIRATPPKPDRLNGEGEA